MIVFLFLWCLKWIYKVIRNIVILTFGWIQNIYIITNLYLELISNFNWAGKIFNHIQVKICIVYIKNKGQRNFKSSLSLTRRISSI